MACDVVWAEVATVYGEKHAELVAALETLGIEYSEVARRPRSRQRVTGMPTIVGGDPGKE